MPEWFHVTSNNEPRSNTLFHKVKPMIVPTSPALHGNTIYPDPPVAPITAAADASAVPIEKDVWAALIIDAQVVKPISSQLPRELPAGDDVCRAPIPIIKNMGLYSIKFNDPSDRGRKRSAYAIKDLLQCTTFKDAQSFVAYMTSLGITTLDIDGIHCYRYRDLRLAYHHLGGHVHFLADYKEVSRQHARKKFSQFIALGNSTDFAVTLDAHLKESHKLMKGEKVCRGFIPIIKEAKIKKIKFADTYDNSHIRSAYEIKAIYPLTTFLDEGDFISWMKSLGFVVLLIGEIPCFRDRDIREAYHHRGGCIHFLRPMRDACDLSSFFKIYRDTKCGPASATLNEDEFIIEVLKITPHVKFVDDAKALAMEAVVKLLHL